MTVVIVGHGRSPEGTGWGKRIDSSANVVRMWDWTWQDPKDCGTKYDYGVIEIHPTLLAKFWQYNKAQPSQGWIGSVLWKYPQRCRLPNNVYLVDQEPWEQMGLQMGGVGNTGHLRFTRGVVAACWSLTNMEKGDELILVGFDSVYLQTAQPVDEAFSPAYQANPGSFPFTHYAAQVTKGVTKHGNHDYVIEKPVLERLSQKHGVKLSFAQEVWDADRT